MHFDRTIGPLAVSIGVAAFPEHGGSLDSLLTAADAALYRAKVRRDCVELAVPHVGSWPEHEVQVENDMPVPRRKPVRKSQTVDPGGRLW